MECVICHKVDHSSNPKKFHFLTWTYTICRLLEIHESNIDKIFNNNNNSSTSRICIDCNGKLVEGQRLLELVELVELQLFKIKNDMLTIVRQAKSKNTNIQDTFNSQNIRLTILEEGGFPTNSVNSSLPSTCQDPADDSANDDFKENHIDDEPAKPESLFNCLTKEARIILEPIQVPHSNSISSEDPQALDSVNIKDKIISNFIKRDQLRIHKSRKNDTVVPQILKSRMSDNISSSVRNGCNRPGPKSYKAKLNKLKLKKDRHQDRNRIKSKPRPKPTFKIKNNLTCLKCNITYAAKGTLDEHNKYKHSKAEDLPSFVCNFCGKVFQRERYLKYHLRSHGIGDGAIQCDFCSKFFKNQKLYERHMNYRHLGSGSANIAKPWSCELCPGKYSTKKAYEDHKMCAHSGEKYTCERCGKTYSSQHAVLSHVKRIHEKVYTTNCPECQKPFVTVAEMNNHFEVIHQGIKRFACTEPDCDKKYSKKHRLLYHIMSVHTSHKPFKCLICLKEFSSSDGFKRHKLLHTGVRNHTCPTCGESYVLKSSLSQHIHERHEGKKVLHPDVTKRKIFVRRNRVPVVGPNGPNGQNTNSAEQLP